jgi:translocator protein
MTLKSGARLVVFLAIVALVSTTGSKFLPGPWYEALAKPAWTPPNWVFPPAWAILYVLIAIAGWRVYERQGFSRALGVWAIGLLLNGTWSVLMFGQHQIGLAAVDVVLLWMTVLAFIVLNWRKDRIASLLFVPYLAWVTYAAALNIAVYLLNPQA